MVTLLLRQGGTALRMLLVATVVLGLVYPLAVWGVSRLPGLHGPAEGSVVTAPDGTPAGSSLIGVDPVPADPAADPWFHTRPSASAEDVLGPGDPSTSGGSNQGGFSDKLLAQVEQRRAAIAAREGVAPRPCRPTPSPRRAPASTRTSAPPTPTCRSPGSPGSPACRRRRSASSSPRRHDGRVLGFLGEPAVNVTRLNLALTAARPAGAPAGGR